MLTGSASRAREWAVFAAIALLPAMAMGVLGFWALRNEEATLLREMRLQVEREANAQKEGFDETLGALRGGARIEDTPFADPASVSKDDLAAGAQSPDQIEQRCRDLADALRRGEAAARAEILEKCRAARSGGGRMLWPLVALAQQGVAADALASWLREHGVDLGAAERSATREEIRSAAWLSETERAGLLDALGAPPGVSAALQGLLSARRVEMLAGRSLIRWSERTSVGELRRRDDGGYDGFVVHAGSLARALRQGWPSGLPEGMTARLSGAPTAAVPAAASKKAVAHAVSLLPGIHLVVAYDDPDAIAWRSKAVLVAVASLAGLIAVALAAMLFARTRRERHLGALRTDFVAAVSHELRTPIASIRMLSELLAEGKAPPDEHDEMHRALAREAKRLGGTVNRLLGFSRMEAGKLTARVQRECVADVVTQVVDTFVERHGVAVERDLDATLQAPVDTDALAMALDNLLENARKYAPNGTPYEVSVTADGADVRIAVRDRGPGIARRDQRRIFRPFERADDRLSQATEGSGIGLSLVQHVARMHGGRVGLESAPGEGATFMMWLPRREGEA